MWSALQTKGNVFRSEISVVLKQIELIVTQIRLT